MYEITLPVTREVFWLLATLVGIIAFSFVIYAALPRQEGRDDEVNLKEVLGAKQLSDPLFALLVILWIVLAMCLFGGLVATIGKIAQLVIVGVETVEDKGARFPLIQLAALTATLGATVALPFTVIRLRLTHEQTATATASLFNQKITEAAADLHAQRQVSKKVGVRKWETLWEDDIVRRNAAIDRLEGLVREEPQEAARVSRLLSVYVRELSDEIPAQPAPDTEEVKQLQEWARQLSIPRSDMQNAAQVLGRLAKIEGVKAATLAIDLRNTNLQAMDLSGLSYREALLSGAKLQRAKLTGAKLQGAILSYAELQQAHLGSSEMSGANLWDANLQGAFLADAELQGASLIRAKLQGTLLVGTNLQGIDLTSAELQGANLTIAELQGANLWNISLDASTNLTHSVLSGASARYVDFSAIPEIANHVDDLFGDDTTKLPKDITRPETWPRDNLSQKDYTAQWRAFAASKGVDIPEQSFD